MELNWAACWLIVARSPQVPRLYGAELGRMLVDSGPLGRTRSQGYYMELNWAACWLIMARSAAPGPKVAAHDERRREDDAVWAGVALLSRWEAQLYFVGCGALRTRGLESVVKLVYKWGGVGGLRLAGGFWPAQLGAISPHGQISPAPNQRMR